MRATKKIPWHRADARNLPEPDVLAAEIIEDLGAALEQFESISTELGRE